MKCTESLKQCFDDNEGPADHSSSLNTREDLGYTETGYTLTAVKASSYGCYTTGCEAVTNSFCYREKKLLFLIFAELVLNLNLDIWSGCLLLAKTQVPVWDHFRVPQEGLESVADEKKTWNNPRKWIDGWTCMTSMSFTQAEDRCGCKQLTWCTRWSFSQQCWIHFTSLWDAAHSKCLELGRWKDEPSLCHMTEVQRWFIPGESRMNISGTTSKKFQKHFDPPATLDNNRSTKVVLHNVGAAGVSWRCHKQWSQMITPTMLPVGARGEAR